MSVSALTAIGLRALSGFAPTLTKANEWAAAEELPQPLVYAEEDELDMSRYSALLPGRLWLHRDYRMIGWGYKWPASLQFKLEYTPEEADTYTHMKTLRVPFLW